MSRRALESPIGRLMCDEAGERSALLTECAGRGEAAGRHEAPVQKIDPTPHGKDSLRPGLAGEPHPPAAHSAEIRRFMRTKHVGTQVDYL